MPIQNVDQELLVLNNDDVVACGGNNMEVVEEIIRDSFVKVEKGDCYLPHKTILKPSFSKGQMNVMPCALKEGIGTLFGTKLIGIDPGNPDKGLPYITASIVLFDPVTKQASAIISGDTLSACRTGAVTRLMARYIIRRAVENVLLIGAGPNMKQQLVAIQPFIDKKTKINIYSRGKSKYDFVECMKDQSQGKLSALNMLSNSSITESDLIIGCIPNMNIDTAPIKRTKLKRGVTFFNIGLYDMDIETTRSFDSYVVDKWSDFKERGDTPLADAYEQDFINDNDIKNFIPFLLNNEIIRKKDDDRFLVSTIGLGSHDVLLGKHIYNEARKRGIGKKIIMNKNSEI